MSIHKIKKFTTKSNIEILIVEVNVFFTNLILIFKSISEFFF